MRRVNKRKKIIIFSLIGLMFLLVVGYAAFQTKLEIKGTSNISSEWRIEITNVSVANKNGLGESVNFSHTKTTASMEANLYEKGDYVEYNVEVSNLGTLDATIDNIANNVKSTNNAVKISFSGYAKGQVLKAKEKQTIKVKIEYDSNYSGTVPEGPAEVEIQPEYIQHNPGGTTPLPDRYLVSYDCTTNGGSCTNYNEYLKEGESINLNYKGNNTKYEFIGWNTDKNAREGITELQMGTENVILYAIYETDPIIQSWAGSPKTDFHSEAYKQSIISAEFLDTREVSANAVESWDVSAAKDGSVMAWVVPDEADNTKHHLYIGGKGGVIANENSSNLFNSFINIKTIEFNTNFDTSNVADMANMFPNCSKLINLDLSSFNTGKVTKMGNMFLGCSSITELDVSNFDTSNVVDMDSMFSGWNRNEDTNSKSALRTINITGFNTSKVINMKGLFSYNDKLEKIIGLSGLDTSNVTNMEGMFNSCSSLTSINLCSFNTVKVTNMYNMFHNTSSLEKVYVGPKWITANADTSNMFLNSKITSVTQSNNCLIDAEDDATINISTTATTKSITVVVDAYAESGISKYEYSIDGGSTWVTGTGNTHTFADLTQNKEYSVSVRVTSTVGKTNSASVKAKTDVISKPTFAETEISNGKKVTITYPAGCGSTYTCSYTKDSSSEVTVTSQTISVDFTADGDIVAKVNDGKNTTSSSYTVTLSVLTTVYAYHEDQKTIGTSKLDTSEYVTDYTKLSSFQEMKATFLKYDINEEGIIKNAYACQIFWFLDEPLCLQGKPGGTYYSANRSILEGLKPAFESNSGNCTIDETYIDEFNNSGFYSTCEVGSGVFLETSDIGHVYVNDNNGLSPSACFIESTGIAHCY